MRHSNQKKVESRGYFMLFLILMSVFGLFFFYDAPGALAPGLKDKFGLSNTQVGSIYSVYSISAVWVQPFGGFLLNKFGTKRLMLIYTAVNSLGALIFTFASTYPVLIVGQAIFGLGSANTFGIMVSAIGIWFPEDDSKRNAKITVINCVATFLFRVASFTSFVVTPRIEDATDSLRFALLFSASSCIISLLCMVIFSIFSKFDPFRPVSKPFIKEDGKFSPIIKPTFSEIVSKAMSEVKLAIKSQTASFWSLYFIIAVATATLFTFTGLCTNFLEGYRGYSPIEAAHVTSLSRVSNAVMTLILAVVIGYFGKKTYWLLFGNSLCLIVYVLFAYTSVSPYILLCLFGIGQACIDSTCWAIISIAVKKEYLAIATSFSIFSYNIGLFILPVVIGHLVDNVSYATGTFVFVICGSIVVFFSITLKISDWRTGGLLDEK